MGGSKGIGTDETISTGGLARDDTPQRFELVPGTMIGEYQIEGELGAGGMGKVYSATHPVIAKRAAIKVLHPELSVNKEAVERFVQEARSVNQIGHPNIVDIFAFGILPDGRNYFVMEWLRGQSLRDRIRQQLPPITDALQILDTIAVALEAAHEKGIVHRDLKPDNVFLVEAKASAPSVKLLDFGIAKLLGSDDHRVERTRTGNLLGTPAYISPEQARGHAVDHRTDIYALGALAYELMTGALPFPSDNAADMIAKHLFEVPPHAAALNPQVAPDLDALICAMLAKDANARPTLEQVRSQLRMNYQQLLASGVCDAPAQLAGSAQIGLQSDPHHMMAPPHGSIGVHQTPPTGMQVHASGFVGALQTAPPAPRKSRAPIILVSSLLALALGIGVYVGVSRNGETDGSAALPAKTDTQTEKTAQPAAALPAATPPAAPAVPAQPMKPIDTPEPAPVTKPPPKKPIKKPNTKPVTQPAYDPDAPM